MHVRGETELDVGDALFGLVKGFGPCRLAYAGIGEKQAAAGNLVSCRSGVNKEDSNGCSNVANR